MPFGAVGLYLVEGFHLVPSISEVMEGQERMRKAMLGMLMVMVVSATGTMMSAPAGAQAHQRSAVRVAGDVELSYSAPEFNEEGTRVTWTWTLSNVGEAAVSKVVLTHVITPQMAVTTADPNCVVGQQSTECKWDSLGPGEVAEGAITADLPTDSDSKVSPEIRGRVVWESSGSAS
ncbi:hypothetical protein [Streptomyces sp. KS 21]|uniref:hypothetical protein n=1 Tax=Streptomyces sp. KS 21 TaxID=2485150 RepID=UPI0010643F1F|nr:hypothetical protein [Streptomyces sp. KS 21]